MKTLTTYSNDLYSGTNPDLLSQKSKMNQGYHLSVSRVRHLTGTNGITS